VFSLVCIVQIFVLCPFVFYCVYMLFCFVGFGCVLRLMLECVVLCVCWCWCWFVCVCLWFGVGVCVCVCVCVWEVGVETQVKKT